MQKYVNFIQQHKVVSDKIVQKTITIHAPASRVWDALTNPALIKVWIWETEIDIRSEWKVGSTLIFRGELHGIEFQNTGTILKLGLPRFPW